MSPVRARPLAWGLASLAMALLMGGLVVYATTDAFEFVATDLFLPAITVAFAIVGALVASRQPGNAIGWIFLGVAVFTGLASIAYGFVEYRLQSDTDPGAFTGAAAMYSEISWIPFVLVPGTFLLLLFPDGRLPSRRWRLIAWCAGAGILGALFINGTTAEPLESFPTVENPFAIDSPVMEPLMAISVLLLWIAVLGSVVSVVARFRRAERLQRQQIKWLATVGALLAVITPIDVALEGILGEGAYVATSLGVLGLPAAVGMAILRHRLYDIDVVINRTLVYGALTATLAGTYLGSVLLLQLLLTPLTASNSLAIAVSTLAVAALFQPARRRIQAIVDRRFYRRKYDAARTLERFGTHLRDQVDLDTLGAELRGVVTDTMQPAHVTLWLRDPAADR